jgi:tetratricopeptide (TPR) repeat protein
VLELARQALGPEDPETLWSLFYLSSVRRMQGNYAAAEAMQREALQAWQRLHGDDHPATIQVKFTLGLTLCMRGETAVGKGLLEEIAQAARRTLGPSHPLTLMAEVNLAETQSILGQEALAIRLLEQLLPRCREVFGPDHSNTITVATSLASCLACQPDPGPDDLKRALELSKKGIDIPTEDQEPLAWNTTGIAQYRRGELKAALAALTKAGALCEGYYKCRNDFFLAMTHQRLGNQDEARACYDRAVRWLDKNRSQSLELPRFRAEAASVLGLKDASKAQTK